MFVRRAALTAIILLNLALLNVLFETGGTRLRYDVARARELARRISLENRRLTLAVASARRTSELQKRAESEGLPLQERALSAKKPAPPASTPAVRGDPNAGRRESASP